MKISRPLRLMVYDRTCTGRGLLPGLTPSWRIGGWLYFAMNRLDYWKGASDWAEALDWLSKIRPEFPIAEIQFWGTPATPKRALWSHPSAPNTISCLHGQIPFVS